MIDINQYRPKQSGKLKKIKSSENGCTHIGNNPDGNECRQYQTDGGVYEKNTAEGRCDYLVLNDTAKRAYFIELKGSNIGHVIEQVEKSVKDIQASLRGYQIFRRIIYKTGSHDVHSSAVLQWKKKCQGTALVKQKQYEETI